MLPNLLTLAGLLQLIAIINPLASQEGEMMSTQSQNRSKIVQIGDPVLRQNARPLSNEEILSPYIQHLIHEMTAIMRDAPGVGLAAPQIGIPIQLIVIEDPKEYHAYLTPEQNKERGRFEVPLHVVINPYLFIFSEEHQTAEFYEGCLSVQGFNGVVSRATSVRVECLNEKAEPVVINANGWYARILQHEIDHLNGILYVDRVKTRSLSTPENFEKYWKGKSVSEICDTLGCEKKLES